MCLHYCSGKKAVSQILYTSYVYNTLVKFVHVYILFLKWGLLRSLKVCKSDNPQNNVMNWQQKYNSLRATYLTGQYVHVTNTHTTLMKQLLFTPVFILHG